ncbi:hypothetical protein PIB30_086268 [Stylosanthes scabra]|uniref:Uncharacterized protein n=1 Tax=Stylosanthes scabra TaxID=79078 RepID=A0ABU6YS13_9FABA|nr:hypothetical protein [Stylosanthes scabra]
MSLKDPSLPRYMPGIGVSRAKPLDPYEMEDVQQNQVQEDSPTDSENSKDENQQEYRRRAEGGGSGNMLEEGIRMEVEDAGQDIEADSGKQASKELMREEVIYGDEQVQEEKSGKGKKLMVIEDTSERPKKKKYKAKLSVQYFLDLPEDSEEDDGEEQDTTKQLNIEDAGTMNEDVQDEAEITKKRKELIHVEKAEEAGLNMPIPEAMSFLSWNCRGLAAP